MKTIRTLGFTDVRLAVPVSALFRRDQPGVRDPQLLAYVDAAIDQIHANGLAMIVDMHVTGSPSLKDDFEHSPALADGFVRFWSAPAPAAHLQHAARNAIDGAQAVAEPEIRVANSGMCLGETISLGRHMSSSGRSASVIIAEPTLSALN